MSKIPLLLTIVLVISLSLYCSDQPKSKESSPLISSELDFSKEFVQRLKAKGIIVIAVKPSVEGALFKVTPNKAVWIKTKQGIFNVVFFNKSDQAKLISITQIQSGKEDSYKYHLKERPNKEPQLIHANRPLYFTIRDNKYIVTDSLKLDKSIKSILTSDR